MLKKTTKILFTIISLSFSFTAQAELIDQYTTTNSEYAQVYKNGTSVNLSIEGAGISQVITLSHYNYLTGYWRGVVPATAVTVNGVASIAVNIDTCALTATSRFGAAPCGLVDVTFNKGDYLWKTNGVRQYTWGNTIRQYVGGISTFSASTVGTVNGVVVDSNRAYIGRYTNVTVIVSTAE